MDLCAQAAALPICLETEFAPEESIPFIRRVVDDVRRYLRPYAMNYAVTRSYAAIKVGFVDKLQPPEGAPHRRCNVDVTGDCLNDRARIKPT